MRYWGDIIEDEQNLGYFHSEVENKNNDTKIIIAGILLIIAGLLSILSWASIFATDIQMLEQIIDLNQFQEIDPSITVESVRNVLTACATIGIIISIFPILGGILAINKKLWGVSLACAIIGLATFLAIIIPGILCIVAAILIYISKEEFK